MIDYDSIPGERIDAALALIIILDPEASRLAVDHITFGGLCGHYESKSSPLNFPSAYSQDQ